MLADLSLAQTNRREFAKRINLDQDELSARVREIASLVGEHHAGA